MRVEQIGDCTTSIYALCEFPSWKPRYVGKTVSYMHQRHKAHIRAANRGSNLPVHRWLRKRLKSGEPVAIKLIEYCGNDWEERERYWIEKLRHDGALLNLTDGGEGLAGLKFSQIHKDRISEALKRGKTHCCSNCGEQFHRKPHGAKSKNLFCSRGCYLSWQVGKKKINRSGTMGDAGRAAALSVRKGKKYA